MPSNGDSRGAGRHAAPQPTATPAAPVRAAANVDARETTPSAAFGQAVGIARLAAAVGVSADPGRQRVATCQPHVTLVALQRAVGNAAVQRLLVAPPAIQRQPGGNRSSRRQGVVTVRWSEDRVDFTHRLSAAVARALRVDAQVALHEVGEARAHCACAISSEVGSRTGIAWAAVWRRGTPRNGAMRSMMRPAAGAATQPPVA